MNRSYFIYILITVLTIVSCVDTNDAELLSKKSSTSFYELDSSDTGIDFTNELIETEQINYFDFPSIYMGGGVSVGDINNDGLDDLFFTGNQVENGLYLNKGNLKFKNIAIEANVTGDNRWYTGVTMADVNNDGFIDIYCSVGGLEDQRENQLYINNGDLTFTEKAAQYGLNDNSRNTQAVFLDYDNDGDLDVYLAVYPLALTSSSLLEHYNGMKQSVMEKSDKLFRNDGAIFTNVTEESGLKNYSFSLGVVSADINKDGFSDLYVSNDFATPDLLYINNQDGTFTNKSTEAFKHTSFYGMGIDIADVNNDGELDLFQVDMDSDNNRRQKANMASMNPRIFKELELFKFQRQHMHNSFQINTGYSVDGVPQFSNASRLTGTSSTDWSWGPLLADFDNDGLKDLLITNGTRREVNNKDYFRDHSNWDWNKTTKVAAVLKIPSERIDNFIFKNNGDLDFEKANDKWNLHFKGFSTGSAYADLDNDGDLEIITCNIDDPVSVFENKTVDKNWLNLSFKGQESNGFGLGVKVTAILEDQKIVQELTSTRGFQSSVAPKLYLGLNNHNEIKELQVQWPSGKEQVLKNVASNQVLLLDENNAFAKAESQQETTKTIFNSYLNQTPEITHSENVYNDYQEQVLLPHKMSQYGPALAVADLNNDQIDDFYMGGAYYDDGAFYISNGTSWDKKETNFSKADILSEDVDATFIDVDMDGDLDLYVVSGGNEFIKTSKSYQDRLYLNDGENQFVKSDALPLIEVSGGKVTPFDYDQDGKMDLMILGRHVPWNYPQPANSVILKNESTDVAVSFTNVTREVAPGFEELGMATSAVLTDYDRDGWQDVMIVGEWMPIKLFKNNKGLLTEVSEEVGLDNDTTGWWWSVEQGDFDNDGDMDYIVGNNGLNYKYKATDDETFDIYANDFDGNSRTDIVLSYYNEGKQFPLRGRECSSQQIPGIKKKFGNYDTFSEATLADVYTEKALENSLHYKVKSFASIYLEKTDNGFKSHELPNLAQLSNITGIKVGDFDKDEKLDVLVAGNLYVSEVETPRNDGGYGLFLKGNGKGDFTAISAQESGVYIPGDVKGLKSVQIKGQNYFAALKNDDNIQFVKWNK